MAWRCGGSLSRSLIASAARTSFSSSIRSTPSISSIPRSLPPSSRRSVFLTSRTVASIGCIQSMIPLHSAVAAACLTSHLSAEARTFCELSQGT